MTGVIGGISIGNFLELPFMLRPYPNNAASSRNWMN